MWLLRTYLLLDRNVQSVHPYPLSTLRILDWIRRSTSANTKKEKNTIFYEIKTFYLAFIGRKKLHQPVYGRVETSFVNLQRVSGATQLATLLAGKACGSDMFGFYMCFDMGFPLRHIVALIAGVAVVSVTVQHGVYQVIQC